MRNDPLAYFITWTCYGTWMPGDERGWTKWHKGDQIPQPLLADWCREQMAEEPLLLSLHERNLVNETVARHCTIRKWHLHAVNCRSNHCHTVVTAPNYSGDLVRDQLKSWCTRNMKNHAEKRQSENPSASGVRKDWWTRKGSVRHLFDDESLAAAIVYTLEAQDEGGAKINRQR